MAFATVDKDNRIIEWSEDHLDGMDIEFQNGDYVNENVVNGSEDFVIIDGIAVFDPRPETIEKLNTVDTNDMIVALFEGLIELASIVTGGQYDSNE